jgi:hypothetical protein
MLETANAVSLEEPQTLLRQLGPDACAACVFLVCGLGHFLSMAGERRSWKRGKEVYGRMERTENSADAGADAAGVSTGS